MPYGNDSISFPWCSKNLYRTHVACTLQKASTMVKLYVGCGDFILRLMASVQV